MTCEEEVCSDLLSESMAVLRSISVLTASAPTAERFWIQGCRLSALQVLLPRSDVRCRLWPCCLSFPSRGLAVGPGSVMWSGGCYGVPGVAAAGCHREW